MRSRSFLPLLLATLACASPALPESLESRWDPGRCPPGTQFRYQSRYWEVFATWPAQWCELPDGTKHGPWSEWFNSGELNRSGTYEFGVRVGTWDIWNRPPWWQVWRHGSMEHIQIVYEAGRPHPLASPSKGLQLPGS